MNTTLASGARRIRRIVQQTDTAAGRAFDSFILLLIVLSIVSLSVETLPDWPPGARRVFNVSEIVITVLFTIEYGLRIATAPKRIEYIFSFYGIVDLIAVLPLYLALGFDLRSARAVRLFRVFRILKITRYNGAMLRFGEALVLAKEEIVIFILITLIFIYFASIGIYYFEHEAQPDQFRSVLSSLWWAVATLTTVGYGDVYPVTVGGKVFTFVILMCGLGIVAMPSALIAAAMLKIRRDEDG